eukprot:GHRR01032817.1.p1 GENE.GHRR01032817.1~~GHRR01032817.1.p1  ORF type:complete len:104 (-),score=16.18 GHRR01032817.1:459-770(-)
MCLLGAILARFICPLAAYYGPGPTWMALCTKQTTLGNIWVAVTLFCLLSAASLALASSSLRNSGLIKMYDSSSKEAHAKPATQLESRNSHSNSTLRCRVGFAG